MKKIGLFLSALLLTIAVLTGCTSGEAVSYTKQHYTPSETISTVSIDVRDRQIEVTASPDEQVHLDYFTSEKEAYTLSVLNGALTMVPDNNKEWSDFIGAQSPVETRKITLQVPENLLDSLSISTTNEDITLDALTLRENLSLKANNGNISFAPLHVGNKTLLDVKNGNLTGTLAGRQTDYTIACNYKKGDCNLPENQPGGEKQLSITANNGDVDIAFTE